MSAQNLLVELQVEELPPKALKKLGEAFANDLWMGLTSYNLTTINPVEYGEDLLSFASPRRLGVWIKAVKSQADDKDVLQKLMPVSVGLDAQGNPTPALVKKMQSLGVVFESGRDLLKLIQHALDGKTAALFYSSTVKGVSLQHGLQKALEETLQKLPIPKVMQYQLHQDCDNHRLPIERKAEA